MSHIRLSHCFWSFLLCVYNFVVVRFFFFRSVRRLQLVCMAINQRLCVKRVTSWKSSRLMGRVQRHERMWWTHSVNVTSDPTKHLERLFESIAEVSSQAIDIQLAFFGSSKRYKSFKKRERIQPRLSSNGFFENKRKSSRIPDKDRVNRFVIAHSMDVTASITSPTKFQLSFKTNYSDLFPPIIYFTIDRACSKQ